jgi:hypothetical protein
VVHQEAVATVEWHAALRRRTDQKIPMSFPPGFLGRNQGSGSARNP